MLLEGLFVFGREDAIPLKSLSVRAFLQGYVVGFRSTLTYENNTSIPLEVFFRTPVDDSYAVVGLEATIDGRKIQAKVQKKKKAKEMYKEAISQGKTAVLGEEKKGDIFSLVLGNLPPGENAVLQLTMVGELAVEPDGAVRFVLPTVLKPRYTPLGSTDPLAPETSTSGSATVHHATGPPVYEFEMVINGAPSIAEVTSPSHEIHVENTGQNINVSLAEEKQADIVILIRSKEVHKPLVIVEPGMSNGENDFQKSTAVMVSFFPEFKGDSSCLQAACEFVFVVDRSGSMEGSYIRDAAQTLLLFLKSIPEGCYFNVIGFGSRYEKLFPESVPYDQKNLEKAVQHAENLQADLGGTELFDPLKYIYSHDPMKGLPRQVFVLTDGSISNTESVIKLVAKNSTNSRCFSFGIGSGASSTLVKGIAEAGKGAAEFITSGERMQAKVIRFLKKAMQPAVTNTQVSYTTPAGVTVTSVPKGSLPAIFIGERLIVYAILHHSSPSSETQEGTVCLTGDLLGAKVEHNMRFQVPLAVTKDNVSQVSTIHHLAAKRSIKEMESSNDSSPEIIQLSCDSNVISSRTAFIAIDEERKEAVKVSLQLTWDMLSFLPDEDADCLYGHPGVSSLDYGNEFGCHEDPEMCSRPHEDVSGCYDVPKLSYLPSEDVYGCNDYDDSGVSVTPDNYIDIFDNYEVPDMSSRPHEDVSGCYDVPGVSVVDDGEDYCCHRDSDVSFLPDEDADIGRDSSSPTYDANFGAKSAPPRPKARAKSGLKTKFLGLFKRKEHTFKKPVDSAPCRPADDSKYSPPTRSRSSHSPPRSSQSTATETPLATIISLQLASGAWKMSTSLSDVISKTTEEIKDACPVSCEGDMESIWATIIALTYLQLRQLNFKDEWELIALKAETWLTKQSLPQGSSIQDLREKAEAFLT
ncbi:von Willebrand factor A domain-containing protein 5A-like isoform X1 [Dendronephthya gigantea]|uniref:von Willebrand factor A domain-containing protein 5A-like isoform X1 n=1 Tax=Dendronephthya gigantea TaxID=151771 RepID=UPI00106BBB98|nr:von Willebrand factor A domain-containing protein 5A-like isoform X1 [Dendronephthya gigantea]